MIVVVMYPGTRSSSAWIFSASSSTVRTYRRVLTRPTPTMAAGESPPAEWVITLRTNYYRLWRHTLFFLCFFFITRTSFGGGGVLNIFHDFSLVFSTISAPNTAFGVLLISPKWYPYFPFKQFWNIFLFILDSLQCMINPYIFTT